MYKIDNVIQNKTTLLHKKSEIHYKSKDNKNMSDNTKQAIDYYRNKRHIRVLYDGFKLSIGCIKATKPEGECFNTADR